MHLYFLWIYSTLLCSFSFFFSVFFFYRQLLDSEFFCQIVGVEIFEIESDVLTEKEIKRFFLSNCRGQLKCFDERKIKGFFYQIVGIKIFEIESDM